VTPSLRPYLLSLVASLTLQISFIFTMTRPDLTGGRESLSANSLDGQSTLGRDPIQPGNITSFSGR